MKVLSVGRFREFKLMKPSNNHKVVHKSETYFMIIKKTTANENDEKDAEMSLRFIIYFIFCFLLEDLFLDLKFL